MKKHLKISFVACVVAVLAVSFAWAGPHRQLVAEVPHDFMIGETMMPAGTYMLERELTNPPMITIRNDQGEGSAIMHVVETLDSTGMGERDAKLVFDKSESTVELSQVWFAGKDGFQVSAAAASRSSD